MRRIPVGQTLRDAYSFTSAHLGGIIGLIWVSMVMLAIARFFTFLRFYNDFIDFMASGNAAHMGSSILMMIGYVVALLLLYAVHPVQPVPHKEQEGVLVHVEDSTAHSAQHCVLLLSHL